MIGALRLIAAAKRNSVSGFLCGIIVVVLINLVVSFRFAPEPVVLRISSQWIEISTQVFFIDSLRGHVDVVERLFNLHVNIVKIALF